MTVVLDAGALVAVERRDRAVLAMLNQAFETGEPVVTHGGVIGQVWRGGLGRQAPLAVFLRSIDVVPLDDELGRSAGTLLRDARAKDVVDAAVVRLARDGDRVLTSDAGDLLALARAARLDVEIVPV